jgi:hypothetical protein
VWRFTDSDKTIHLFPQVPSDLAELVQRSLEVLGDLNGNDVGIGEIGGIFARPADPGLRI